MSRYDNGERLNDHNDLKGCKVFRPIVEFSTDEVWTTLLQRRPPWGGSHRDLVALYKDGQGGECPLVLSKEDAPSCGTSSSRFGCWTCTVVVKDRSMAGFIEAGHENLEPLMDFRDWLAEIRNDPARRSARRRNGQTTFLADGSLVPGPFTPAARREILDRLRQVERATGRTLITLAEVDAINRIWAEDAAARLPPLRRQLSRRSRETHSASTSRRAGIAAAVGGGARPRPFRGRRGHGGLGRACGNAPAPWPVPALRCHNRQGPGLACV
jgi:DNA sulfur modification protein DndC